MLHYHWLLLYVHATDSGVALKLATSVVSSDESALTGLAAPFPSGVLMIVVSFSVSPLKGLAVLLPSGVSTIVPFKPVTRLHLTHYGTEEKRHNHYCDAMPQGSHFGWQAEYPAQTVAKN